MTLLPKRNHTKAELVVLLMEARRLANQTVKSSSECAAWHRKTDRALQGEPGDDPEERYDLPARLEHQEFVDRLFTRRRA
jgi:hypothetical protein